MTDSLCSGPHKISLHSPDLGLALHPPQLQSTMNSERAIWKKTFLGIRQNPFFNQNKISIYLFIMKYVKNNGGYFPKGQLPCMFSPGDINRIWLSLWYVLFSFSGSHFSVKVSESTSSFQLGWSYVIDCRPSRLAVRIRPTPSIY